MSKKIIALILCVAFVFSLTACSGGKGGDKNGEKAVTKAKMSKGTPKAPGDVFDAPQFEASANGPKLGQITAQAYANDSITLTGEGFSASDIKAYVYTQSTKDNGKTQEAKITVTEDQTAAIILDKDTEYGIHGVYVESSKGKSNVLFVNRPKIWWIGVRGIYAGSELKIFGENLTTDNKDKAYVYLLSEDNEYCELKVTFADPYKIVAEVPEGLEDGKEYEVLIHNGHGGEIGFAKAEEKVKYYAKDPYAYDGKVHDVTKYGAEPKSNSNDDTAAIQAAIDAAENGDIIYFPTGIYQINSTIYLDKAIKLEGVSKERTIFVMGDTLERSMFETASGPVEFVDVTFFNTTTDTLAASFLFVQGNAIATDHYVLNVHDCEFVQESLKMNEPDHPSITLFDTNNINIENNVFKVPKLVFINKAEKVFMNNNLHIGTGFAYGTHFATNATMIWNLEGFESHKNQFYAKNAPQDKAQPLKTGDYTSGRTYVFQQVVNNTYLGYNTIIGSGNPNENCGEEILFENGNALFFDYIKSGDKNSVVLNTTSSKTVYENYLLLITDGKGKGQARIVKDYNSSTKTITVKEPFNIAPDSTSRISVVHQSGYNSAIHKNKIDCYTNYDTDPGATTAIQCYANNYNFFVTDNEFSNMTWGICLSPAFSTTDLGTPRICGMYWMIIDNNDISNACAGIRLNTAITAANKDLDFEIVTGLSIRKNNFHDFKRFAKGSYESYTGGTGFLVGDVNSHDFLLGKREFLSTVVIENNIFSNCPVEDVRLNYHQFGTILRNNKNADGGDIKVTVAPTCKDAIYIKD